MSPISKTSELRAQVLDAAKDGSLSKAELTEICKRIGDDQSLRKDLVKWLDSCGEPELARVLTGTKSGEKLAAYFGGSYKVGDLVENAATRAAINKYLGSAKGDTFEAYRLSLQARDAAPIDPALRNAEHYLFAAAVIPEQSNLGSKALMTTALAVATPAYSAAKAVVPKRLMERAMGSPPSEGNQTSNPTVNEVRWGLKGVKDGAWGGPKKQDDLG